MKNKLCILSCLIILIGLSACKSKPADSSSQDVSASSQVSGTNDSSTSANSVNSTNGSGSSSGKGNTSSKSTNGSKDGGTGSDVNGNFVNTKGIKVNVNLPGKELKPEMALSYMKNYAASGFNNGPTGKNDKERVYILLYNHTDDHAERYPKGTVLDKYVYPMEINLRSTYPNLKLGNQYGARYYDWFTIQALVDDDYNQAWKKLKPILSSPQSEIVGGTWSQAVSAFLGEEAAVLQFKYAQETIKKVLNKNVKYYGYSENTGYTYLPQILKDFGYEGAIMRTHWQPLGSSPSYKTSYGLWTGPDGSYIGTLPTAPGDNFRISETGIMRPEAALTGFRIEKFVYNSSTLKQLNNYYNDKKKQGLDYVVATVVEDAIFDEFVPKLMAELKTADPKGEKYQIVNAQDLFKILKNTSNTPSLSPKPNDWNIYWSSGYYNNLLTQALAQTTSEVDSAEKLLAFTKLAGLKNIDDSRGAIDGAWKDILSAEAHDAHVVSETTDISLRFLGDARRKTASIMTEAADTLAKNVNTKHSGESVIVMNTQSFDRHEIITAEVTLKKNVTIDMLKEADSGVTIPFDILSIENIDGKNKLTIAFVSDVYGFGHNTYNVVTKNGIPEITVKQNTKLTTNAKAGSCQLSGKDFYVNVEKNGNISGISLKDGTKVIDSAGYFSGRFYNTDNFKSGSLKTSELSVVSVEEGATMYRVVVSGKIDRQNITQNYVIYKQLPFMDVKIDFQFAIKTGIGNMEYKGTSEDQIEAWSESNTNSRKERLTVSFKPSFQYGNGNPYQAYYNLYSPSKYNSITNVARYTPYFPENFKRQNESNTLQSFPDTDVNHIYDIFTQRWIDVSDTQGTKGFSVLTKGNAAYVYDGKELSLVLGQSTIYNPIYSNMGSVALQFSDYYKGSGKYSYEYRIVPHLAKQSTVDYKIGNNSAYDIHKAGTAYNYPMVVCSVSGSQGKVSPKYRYLLADTGTGTITNTLRLIDNTVYARSYEYAGLRWGEARFVSNGKLLTKTTMHMDMKTKNSSAKNYMDPYKISTFMIK